MLTRIASSSEHRTLYAAELMLVGEGCQEKVRSETLVSKAAHLGQAGSQCKAGPGKAEFLAPTPQVAVQTPSSSV